MLGLFIDESSDRLSHVVCGVLAKVGAWDRFVPKWNEVLAIPPKLPYWHQSDAYAIKRKPPFDVLTDEQVKKRETWLAAVLRCMNARIIASAMTVSDYEAVKAEWLQSKKFASPKERKRWEKQTHPYSVLHATWVERLHRTASKSTELVMIVMERSNDPYRDSVSRSCIEILSAESVLRRGYPDRIGLVGTVPGKNPMCRPLEAADLAAWVVRRNWSGLHKYPLSNRVLSQRHKVECFDIDKRAIRGFFRQMDTWRSHGF